MGAKVFIPGNLSCSKFSAQKDLIVFWGSDTIGRGNQHSTMSVWKRKNIGEIRRSKYKILYFRINKILSIQLKNILYNYCVGVLLSKELSAHHPKFKDLFRRISWVLCFPPGVVLCPLLTWPDQSSPPAWTWSPPAEEIIEMRPQLVELLQILKLNRRKTVNFLALWIAEIENIVVRFTWWCCICLRRLYWRPHILFSTPSHHSCMASLTTPLTKSLWKTSVGSLEPSPRLGLLVSFSVMISTAELKYRNHSVNGHQLKLSQENWNELA